MINGSSLILMKSRRLVSTENISKPEGRVHEKLVETVKKL